MSSAFVNESGIGKLNLVALISSTLPAQLRWKGSLSVSHQHNIFFNEQHDRTAGGLAGQLSYAFDDETEIVIISTKNIPGWVKSTCFQL